MGLTLREALAAGTETLATNPQLRDRAARDAELLLLFELGISKAQRLAYSNRQLSADEEFSFRQSIHRRLANEPLQYITGVQEFYGLSFQVTPAVLIPRPETEHLVEAVLELFPKDQPIRLLDVGTGSGILAVTYAVQLRCAEMTAVDLSPDALAVARHNAAAHGVGDRVRFVESDLLRATAGERFDAIVSNPPYVPLVERASLHPEVRDYEPAMALFAGDAGLDIYRRLIPAAWEALVPGGLLALEIGFGQRKAVGSLLGGWDAVSFRNDLQGIPRVALAKKRS